MDEGNNTHHGSFEFTRNVPRQIARRFGGTRKAISVGENHVRANEKDDDTMPENPKTRPLQTRWRTDIVSLLQSSHQRQHSQVINNDSIVLFIDGNCLLNSKAAVVVTPALRIGAVWHVKWLMRRL